jgi:amino acid adenylation domain-containing protein/non-ribosomal peptide synthase protein (TIGR01720 family)
MKNVEDVYPLSPMQQGMLFHTLYDPGLYMEQTISTLHGNLNIEAFQRAWQYVVDRHPVLRTAFLWEGLASPLQVVRRQARLSWTIDDWRGVDPAEQESRLQQFVRDDLARGFDLGKAPLMRLALFRSSDDTYHFVWSQHHILLDGWSLPQVLSEVFRSYEAFAQGRELPLPRPRPYRDYIAWLQRQDMAQAEAFWRRFLAGFSAPTPLGVDRAISLEPDEPQHGGHEIHLPADLSGSLQALARQHGLTLNTLMQGAWALLLSRYSGERDLVFGTTVSGRPADLPGVEQMIGLFINTLPVRVQIRPETTVLAWLKDLQAQQAELRQYEYSPLVEVQGWSEVPRGQALFDSLLVFENYPVSEGGGPGDARPSVVMGAIRSDEGSNYPLNIIIAPADRIALRVNYDRRRFDAATIERLVGHFRVVLAAMAAQPQQRLGDLSLHTPAERRQILGEWNATAAPFPQDRCLHELIAAQAERRPGAIAVAWGEQQLSYHELNLRANQLAHRLQQLGVGPDARVGLCLPRSLDLVVALLAVLKAGGAYLPLDPGYPQELLRFMLSDAEVAVLLTVESLKTALPEIAGHVLSIDADHAVLAQGSPINPPSYVQPQNLAYVIYTSGSTGQPKGVQVAHQGLVNMTLAQQAAFGVSDSSRVLQFASISFDASISEIAMALSAGALLELLPNESPLVGAELLSFLNQRAITHVTLPPSVLATLPYSPDVDALPELETLIVAGEACSPELMRRWARGRRFVNAYGPTETTVCATVAECRPDEPLTIGRPIANSQAYLLDDRMEPVPVGVIGELYLAGVGLARGYLHRPDLTAERFVPNPFSHPEGTRPGARLYRSGDLARYTADGRIDYVGRADTQVKLRGYRIEPEQIAAQLRQHPQVADALVLARFDTGEQRLVAYVVREPANTGTGEHSERVAAALREHLKQRLPSYMLPSAIVELDAWPLTPNGKIDRKALPAPDQHGSELESAFVAPYSPLEDVLAGIWADVLRRERVGVHDSFFDLGGHSLLATQVVSRIREALKVELSLRELLEAPTIAALALKVAQARQAAPELIPPPLVPVAHDDGLPLSFAQQRLWFLAQMDPSSPAYNIPNAMRIRGPLNVAALEQSLNAIVRRHEVLRTTFRAEGGQPVQVITPALTIPLPLVDLQFLPADVREARAITMAGEEAQRSFDLQHGPLLRASLLQLDTQEYVLLWSVHHIAADGWSMSIFMRELLTFYRAIAAGTPDAAAATLPALPIQYADYAVWQRSWLQGAVLEAQLDYWKQQLAETTPLQLPTDYPRPAVATLRGTMYEFEIPQVATETLRAIGRRDGATLFMTLLAAWQVLLSRYSGQQDIAVGTPIANRTRGETEDLIGCFINTVVLRSDLSGAANFRDVLKRVRETALGAYAHQDLPFEQIVDAVEPERDLSRHPIFQVMFALQAAPSKTLEASELSLSPVTFEYGISKFDLSLSLTETSDGLGGILEYSTDLFAAETIVRMTEHFAILLAGIAANPEQPLASLPLLTAAEQESLAAWNATAQPYAQERLVHELIAAQAARTPNAVALICGDERLSYAELDRRANRLAHHLRAQGVGPESRVALLLERSVDLVVALLAVLKAGGAYVPIDPSYPAERVAFILDDSAPTVVLSQESLRAGLSAASAPIVSLEADAPLIAQQPESAPASGGSLGDLAYLIYTSGTTGTPKAVLVEHGNLLQVLHASQTSFGYRADDVQPWLASVAFDIAAFELFNPLLVGGTVVIQTQAQILDLPQLVVELQSWTLLHAVPSLLRQIVSAAELGTTERYQGLRRIWVGGDAVPPELLADTLAVFPQAELVVLYGPTEATIICACHRVERKQPPTRPIIGRPLPNAQLRLYDANRQLVPIGVAGELYIGGGSVTRGYQNRPELTAEKFVLIDGQRWYRSGDVARFLPDGTLEFLGRTDAQVKIRGYRIEIGEVEAALALHPQVREAVVLARADGGEQRLVAYLVPDGETTPTADDVRQFLLAKLPPYMVPSAFVILESLPLTRHGKVDRKALPAPDQSNLAHAASYVAPQNEIEQTLAGIWAEVLRLERVGVHDNFFSLGGDSILSIQVIARANQAGLRLTPRQIFQHQTIAELATVADTAPAVIAEQGLVTGLVPLTPIQHDFFAQPIPNRHHFNQTMLVEASERLDADALERAMQQLVAHHDALRLCFRQTEQGWQQEQALPDERPILTTIDLQSLPEAEQAAAFEAAATELQTSLDLGSGLLLRAALVERGPSRPQWLFLVVHHLAVDAVSWSILLEDVQSAYTQARRSAEIVLPPKTTAFKQWAERLLDYAAVPTLLGELPFWLSVAQRSVPALPVDHPAGANSYASARNIIVKLSEAETQALLHEVPNAYQTQITEVLLAALAQTLNAWTGGSAQRVNLEGHGREDLFEDVDLSRTVGWFTSLYPVLLDLSQARGLGDTLKTIKEQLRQVPNRGIGYGVLRYLNSEDRGAPLREHPPVEISFNYVGQIDQALPQGGLFSPAAAETGPEQDRSAGRRAHVIDIISLISGGQLSVGWTFSTELHQQATIERLAQDYISALQALIAHCLSPDSGGFTPSDFAEYQWDQTDLDDITAAISKSLGVAS